MVVPKHIIFDFSRTGVFLYCIIRRESDRFLLDNVDGVFRSSPANMFFILTENVTVRGRYELTENRQIWPNGLYSAAIYLRTGTTPIPAQDVIVGTGEMFVERDREVGTDVLAVWATGSRSLTSREIRPGEHIAREETVTGRVGLHVVTIQMIREGTTEVVPGVAVTIYDHTGTIIVAFGETDLSGQFRFGLDAGTYRVRTRRFQWQMEAERTITVTGSVTHTIPGRPVADLLVTLPAELQRLFGTVRRPDGSLMGGVEITAEVRRQQIVSRAVLAMVSLSSRTDANGQFSLILVRGAEIRMNVGGFYFKDIVVTNEATRDFALY